MDIESLWSCLNEEPHSLVRRELVVERKAVVGVMTNILVFEEALIDLVLNDKIKRFERGQFHEQCRVPFSELVDRVRRVAC